jgi:hypothetical protein
VAELSVTADIARAGSGDMRFTEQMRKQFLFKLFKSVFSFDDCGTPAKEVRVAGAVQESL